MWERLWEHFTTFLKFPAAIRRIAYIANVVESLNSRFRRVTRLRGYSPDEKAALRVLYLVVRDRQPSRQHAAGRTRSWKEAINALACYCGERVAGQ